MMIKTLKEKVKISARIGRKTYSLLTAFNRKVPDFIIIGTQKGGTSSLYSMLCRHPQIERAVIKEIHYFDKNFFRKLHWYKQHFPSKLFHNNCITGEASPYYIIHPLAPERVAQLLPKVRILVILRNPVERAYSHYQMVKRKGFEPAASFEEAIELEESRLSDEFERLKNDPEYQSLDYQRYSYLARGRYAEQLQRWYNFFPKNQILILKSEELFENPNAILNCAFKFLELPPFNIHHKALLNKADYNPINPATAERLQDYFSQSNKKLEELTGIKFGWN